DGTAREGPAAVEDPPLHPCQREVHRPAAPGQGDEQQSHPPAEETVRHGPPLSAVGQVWKPVPLQPLGQGWKPVPRAVGRGSIAGKAYGLQPTPAEVVDGRGWWAHKKRNQEA